MERVLKITNNVNYFKDIYLLKHYLIVHGDSMYYMLKINICQVDISKAFSEIFRFLKTILRYRFYFKFFVYGSIQKGMHKFKEYYRSTTVLKLFS